MSTITLNIVEPGSGPIDPVVPNTSGTVAPDTGLFTGGIGSSEATIITIVSTVLILAIVGIILTTYIYRKHKKQGKTTKLVHLVDGCKAIITNKKRITTTLATIALLVSTCTFITLAKNAVNAAEGDEQSQTESTSDSNLTVNVSDEELTIELSDEPVFAVLPVDITVEQATQAGYTLTAYTNNTDLVSTTNPDNAIPMIAVEGDELEALTDNTYGLALGDEPTSKDEAVYTTLSIDSEEPTIIKSMTEYAPTAENDITTIYYGFYITPNIPYGTYTNDGEVYYNATINTTLVTFDGKGLYFDEEQTQTTNTVEYIAVSQENNETKTSSTINQPISGEYKTPSQSLPYRFLGWSTDPTATEPTYTSEDDIAEHLPILPNTPLTLYAVWQKATELSFDGNDNDGGTGISSRTIAAGSSTIVPENTFTKEDFHFTSWNTDKYGEGQEYLEGAEYTAQADFAGYVTLYAQWEENEPQCDENTICYRPNGANGTTTMGAQSVSSSSTRLWASNYQYDTNNDGYNDYGFAGWSTDKHAAAKINSANATTIYGPNQIIDNSLVSDGMNLYAVWISPALDANNQPLTFQTENLLSTTLSDGTTLANKNNGYVTALVDSRDDQVYAVAKLADGNYWMIENLRLDDTAEITADNTDNPAEGFTALPASSINWCTDDYSAICINQPYLNTSNTANAVAEMTTAYVNVYSYGNYYNWYSATAGNGTYNTNNEEAAGSICPAGWQLPLGNKNNTPGAFYYLYTVLDNGTVSVSKILRSFPNDFVYSGSQNGSEVYPGLGGGKYMSSTGGKYNFDVYGMEFDDEAVSFDRDHHGSRMGVLGKRLGYSIRCIMQKNN